MKTNTYSVDVMTNAHGQMAEEAWVFSTDETIEDVTRYIYKDMAHGCEKWDYLVVYNEDDDVVAYIYRNGNIDIEEE